MPLDFAQHHLWYHEPSQKKDLKKFNYALIDGKEVLYTHQNGWRDDCQVPDNAKYLGVGDYLHSLDDKMLFLALIAKYYWQFKEGTKGAEYRRYGGSFTEKNYKVGRRVNVRRGYSTDDNLYGVVTHFKTFMKHDVIGPLRKTLEELYGPENEQMCEIGIKIDGV